MTSYNRPLSGKALHHRLADEHRSSLIDRGLLNRSGRSARTLIKDGPLRVTLVSLAAGGSLSEHHATGPITIHTLSGTIRFRAGDDEWLLEPGDLLSLGASVPHTAES